MKSALVLVLGAAGLLSACGLKGDLYLEQTPAPTPAGEAESKSEADKDTEEDEKVRDEVTAEDSP